MSVGLLRFLTAGSVDDGKSTLIGRMLVDARGAFEDQVSAATRDNERRGGKGTLRLGRLSPLHNHRGFEGTARDLAGKFAELGVVVARVPA